MVCRSVQQYSIAIGKTVLIRCLRGTSCSVNAGSTRRRIESPDKSIEVVDGFCNLCIPGRLCDVLSCNSRQSNNALVIARFERLLGCEMQRNAKTPWPSLTGSFQPESIQASWLLAARFALRYSLEQWICCVCGAQQQEKPPCLSVVNLIRCVVD